MTEAESERSEARIFIRSERTQMTTRWPWSVAVLVLVAALWPGSAFAQGDGPRVHSKELLAHTSLFSLGYIHASGNANGLDPAHSILVDADFEIDLALLGFSHSFPLFDRTAVASLVLPAGELEAEVSGPLAVQDSARG